MALRSSPGRRPAPFAGSGFPIFNGVYVHADDRSAGVFFAFGEPRFVEGRLELIDVLQIPGSGAGNAEYFWTEMAGYFILSCWGLKAGEAIERSGA